MSIMARDFKEIKDLFRKIKQLPKLDDRFCIIFVYNTPATMRDSFHTTECVFSEEQDMIISSFKHIAEVVYSIDGEDQFIEKINIIKQKHEFVMVYSMAQNITGNGRRSLIPLLCEYYGFINIGADFMSCALGRSKDLMYYLLKDTFTFPQTFYIKKGDSIEGILPAISSGKWLLKPNNESSSIGIEIHVFNEISFSEICSILDDYRKKHPTFCIQEFIEGDEVAVPILKIQDYFYCPGISQVAFPTGINHISYDMIALGTYGYFEYEGPLRDSLISIAAGVSKQLGLSSMSRIDFRIRNNIAYIEDIGANPTISQGNGVNQIYCHHLDAKPWCIYAILAYSALMNYGLFEPTLH